MSETLQSVDFAIKVLSFVAYNPDLTLSKIARSLGETKPRVLRVLRTLEQNLLVRQTNAGYYRLGIGSMVLGTAATTQVDLVKYAMPQMEKIVQRVNETVQLSIVDGSDSLCIAKFEPTRDLRVNAKVGRRRPLYLGSRKVLLAHLPRATQEKLIPQGVIPIAAGKTVLHSQILLQLELIKKRWYCVSQGEINEQLISVSVPILSKDGALIASINIVAPAFRTRPDSLELFHSILTESSQKLTTTLEH